MSKDLTSRFPHLFQFLGAYLHQDWVDEASSADEIVTAYAGNQSREQRERVADEIDSLLASVPEDGELSRALLELGCYYAPEADGRTPSGWLRQVAGVLRGGA